MGEKYVYSETIRNNKMSTKSITGSNDFCYVVTHYEYDKCRI